MPRRKRTTVSEFLAELSRDPEYLARVAERDRRITQFAAEFEAEDRQLAKEAGKLGYRIESVWCFVNNTPHSVLRRTFIGPYERAYPMLVRHLRLPHHQRVREGIIRALTVKDGGPMVAGALLAEFLTEKNPNLKWVLANALRAAMPLKERKRYPEIARILKGAL